MASDLKTKILSSVRAASRVNGCVDCGHGRARRAHLIDEEAC